MPLTDTPVWPQGPKIGTAVLTGAETSISAPASVTTLVTAGENGTRIDGLYVGPRATVTATAVRFFLSQDNGTSLVYLPHLDKVVPAHTIADTTANGGVVKIIDLYSQTDFFDLPGGVGASAVLLGCTMAVALAGGMAFTAYGHDL